MPEDLRQETPPHPWQKRFLPLIPALLAIAVFLPTLGNGFVNWDDPYYIYENLHIRHLDLRWIFTAVVVSNYHPLTLLSHTLDYRLFGLNPMGHHITNIILHAINSAFVFLLAKRLLRGGYKSGYALPAMAAALLFAVHPLHVESVAWASERKDVLSAFFFLLALLSYLRYARGPRKGLYYGLTLIIFILALLSKPMAVTLPAVLLLLDYYPLKRPVNNRLLIEKIPFFALSAASAIVTLWAQESGGSLRSFDTHSIATRLYIAAQAVTFYPYKLILPANLSPYYPMPHNTRLFSLPFISSLILIIVITLLCLIALMRKKRWPITLWAFYLVTLLPVSGLVTVGGQVVADRYAYIPTMVFFLLAGGIIGVVTKAGNSGRIKAVTYMVLILIIALFGLQAIRQEYFWRDSITLMSRAITLYPDSATLPYTNRGLVHEKEGNLPLALKDYNKAIAISPGFSDAYINRGIIYGESSLFDKAIDDFSRAISLDPSSAKAYMNRGAVYMREGDYESALKNLRRAIALDPKDATTHFNLGLAYFNTGNKMEALKSMERAAALGLPEAREFISKEGLY